LFSRNSSAMVCSSFQARRPSLDHGRAARS
jgi:hypothetical protein